MVGFSQRKRIKYANKKSVIPKGLKCASKKRRAGVFYSPKRKVNRQPLRDLVQPAYPEVCKYSESKWRNIFLDHGVYPSKQKPKNDRWCWKCHQKLTLEKDGKTLRCNSNKKCNLRVRNADVAYTPQWMSKRRGKGLTCKAVGLHAYNIGLRAAQDATRHYTGSGRKLVTRMHHDAETACAFAEYTGKDDVVFDEGEVDIDTAASATVRTDPTQTTFTGRFL